MAGNVDADLLGAWAAGDKAAGQALFNRHFDAVYRFFRNKLGLNVIDDLVQQTFLGCVEARDRYRGDASFRSFLFQIARHQLYAYFRAVQRDQRLDFTVSGVHDLGTSPTGMLARRDDEHCMLDALQRLPVDLQVVLELVFWENLTASEIGRVLEIPDNTVYSRVHRAKLLLREALSGMAPAAFSLRSSEDSFDDWLRSVRLGSASSTDESC